MLPFLQAQARSPAVAVVEGGGHGHKDPMRLCLWQPVVLMSVNELDQRAARRKLLHVLTTKAHVHAFSLLRSSLWTRAGRTRTAHWLAC